MSKDGDHTVGDTPVHNVNDVNIIRRGRAVDEEEQFELMEANPPHEQRPALDPHRDDLDESLGTRHNLASTAEVEAYREAAETGQTTVAGRLSEAGAHADDKTEKTDKSKGGKKGG